MLNCRVRVRPVHRQRLGVVRGRVSSARNDPGIDRVTACAILIEPGPDMATFGATSRLAARADLRPGNKESAGNRGSGRGRRGNKTLRSVLVECLHAAGRKHPPVPCRWCVEVASARSAPPRTSACESSRILSDRRPYIATRIPTTRRCSSGATRCACCASFATSTSSCANDDGSVSVRRPSLENDGGSVSVD